MSFCPSCEGLGTRLRNLESGSGGDCCQPDIVPQKWTLETNAAEFTPAVVIPVNDFSVIYFEFHAVARAADGTSRAGFRRSGVVYREGGAVILQNASWHTEFTSKSLPAYNVGYTEGASTFTLNVLPPTANSIRWSGLILVHGVS